MPSLSHRKTSLIGLLPSDCCFLDLWPFNWFSASPCVSVNSNSTSHRDAGLPGLAREGAVLLPYKMILIPLVTFVSDPVFK